MTSSANQSAFASGQGSPDQFDFGCTDGVRFFDTTKQCEDVVNSFFHGGLREIGAGGWGTVYKGKLKSGAVVAVKAIDSAIMKEFLEVLIDSEGEDSFLDATPNAPGASADMKGHEQYPYPIPAEVRTMRLLPDDHRVAQIRGAFIPRDTYSHLENPRTVACFLFLDYYNASSLYDLSRRHMDRGQPIPEAFIWHVAHSVTKALRLLQEKQIAHGDVSLPNIVLHYPPERSRSSYPDVKLIDFGLAGHHRAYSNPHHSHLVQDLTLLSHHISVLTYSPKLYSSYSNTTTAGTAHSSPSHARGLVEDPRDSVELTKYMEFLGFYQKNGPGTLPSKTTVAFRVTINEADDYLQRVAPPLIESRFKLLPDYDRFEPFM